MRQVGPPPPEPARKVRADALDRAEKIWALRIGGATWDQRAKAVGLTTRQNAIRCVREAYGEVPQVDREELRHLWRERNEMVWRQALRDVLDRRQGAVVAATKSPRSRRSSMVARSTSGGWTSASWPYSPTSTC